MFALNSEILGVVGFGFVFWFFFFFMTRTGIMALDKDNGSA